MGNYDYKEVAVEGTPKSIRYALDNLSIVLLQVEHCLAPVIGEKSVMASNCLY